MDGLEGPRHDDDDEIEHQPPVREEVKSAVDKLHDQLNGKINEECPVHLLEYAIDPSILRNKVKGTNTDHDGIDDNEQNDEDLCPGMVDDRTALSAEGRYVSKRATLFHGDVGCVIARLSDAVVRRIIPRDIAVAVVVITAAGGVTIDASTYSHRPLIHKIVFLWFDQLSRTQR